MKVSFQRFLSEINKHKEFTVLGLDTLSDFNDFTGKIIKQKNIEVDQSENRLDIVFIDEDMPSFRVSQTIRFNISECTFYYYSYVQSFTIDANFRDDDARSFGFFV